MLESWHTCQLVLLHLAMRLRQRITVSRLEADDGCLIQFDKDKYFKLKKKLVGLLPQLEILATFCHCFVVIGNHRVRESGMYVYMLLVMIVQLCCC